MYFDATIQFMFSILYELFFLYIESYLFLVERVPIIFETPNPPSPQEIWGFNNGNGLYYCYF